MALNHEIQMYRGLESDLPTLSEGQTGFANDNNKVFVGDGTNNHEVLMHNEFSANSVLAANTADTPAPLSVAEDTVVGRKTGGNINSLGGSDVLGILSGSAASSFSMNSQKITGLLDGVDGQDAATVSQIDASQAGLDSKESVRVSTTANITDLSIGAPDTVDGVSLASGDRVLVKEQTTASENGIYVVDTVGTGSDGSWSRASDADTDAEVTAGLYCWIDEGTSHGDQGFVLTTNDPITVGTTALTFTQFSGLGQVTPGTNLSKTGDTLNVSPQGSGSGLNADQLDGVELANITWTDVAMAKTDVTASDVGLGNVTNDAQIAKDGTIAFTGSQSLSGNDLTEIGKTVFDEIATPVTPAAGYNALYFKSDDELYMLDDAGNEVLVSGSAGDELVGVDSAATPGYIGAASSDGVLRTGSAMSYTDGGDFVTLDVGNVDCGTW